MSGTQKTPRVVLVEPKSLRSSAERRASKATWFCVAEDGDERIGEFAVAVRGWRAKLAKVERGWTQADVARRLSVSQPQWSNLETGKVEPLPRFVWMIEREFRVPPGTFSQILGYAPAGPNRALLYERVEDDLDSLIAIGEGAVEEVLDRDTNYPIFRRWRSDLEEVGIERLKRVSLKAQRLEATLNDLTERVEPAVRARIAEKVAEIKAKASHPHRGGALDDFILDLDRLGEQIEAMSYRSEDDGGRNDAR